MIKAEGSGAQKKEQWPPCAVRADIQINMCFSLLSGLLYTHSLSMAHVEIENNSLRGLVQPAWHWLKLSRRLSRKTELNMEVLIQLALNGKLHFPIETALFQMTKQGWFYILQNRQISLNGQRGYKSVEGINMKTGVMGKAVCQESHILLRSLRSPVCLQFSQELQLGFSHSSVLIQAAMSTPLMNL